MRQWQVRRALQPHPDGQRRWDRTYQQLMAWTQTPQSGAVVPAGPVPPPEEDSYEDRDICPGEHAKSWGAHKVGLNSGLTRRGWAGAETGVACEAGCRAAARGDDRDRGCSY